MNKYLFTAAMTLTVALGGYAEVPQAHIYCTDGGFIRMEGATGARHSEAGGIKIVRIEANGENRTMAVDRIDHIDLRTVGVPRIHIDIPDNPDITQIVEKETYLQAEISMEGNGYVEDFDKTAVSVKGRGNSTWWFPKKPMRLKFSKKISLGGLKKAKNYVLLANYIDPSLMRNTMALWIAREMGIPWANHIVPCDVTFNGNDLGAFMLTEKVGINGASVDIDETQGVLLELSDEFDEKYKFRSAKYNLPVMVKDPDFDELSEEDSSWGTPDEKLSAWKADFEHAEELVAGGRGFEAFDLDSFVDYLLLYNIVLNSEIGHPKSLYIHKERLGGDCKWQCGPVWDFDASFNLSEPYNGGFRPRPAVNDLWVNAMFGKLTATPGFMERYKARLAEFQADIYPRMLEFFDEYAELVRPSAKVNGQIWPGNHDTGWCLALDSFNHEQHTKDLRKWLVERVAHLARLAEQNRLR